MIIAEYTTANGGRFWLKVEARKHYSIAYLAKVATNPVWDLKSTIRTKDDTP